MQGNKNEMSKIQDSTKKNVNVSEEINNKISPTEIYVQQRKYDTFLQVKKWNPKLAKNEAAVSNGLEFPANWNLNSIQICG